MAEFTKREVTMQYTETVYYRDGEEIERIRNYDDHSYDESAPQPMTEQEIEDYS